MTNRQYLFPIFGYKNDNFSFALDSLMQCISFFNIIKIDLFSKIYLSLNLEQKEDTLLFIKYLNLIKTPTKQLDYPSNNPATILSTG